MSSGTVTGRLLASHLVSGELEPGSEIGLHIDQTLTQDATGTLVMLELEAMGIDRVKTEVSAQYVDHNLLQVDHKNPDDHLFLLSAARRFGLWYSRPGEGVSHPVHMSKLGKPGKTLLGSDSHTCASGALGMLAIGAGGIEVALAMAGEPFYLRCPEVWGVRLDGELPAWVSAKDVILEMLRRHGVKGGVGRVIEYYGAGIDTLTAMDRHVLANMGAELGATSTVFPSDGRTRAFLERHGRVQDWIELLPDARVEYDIHETIQLDELEPLIAKPSSPGNVVPVREVRGEDIYQAYIGSSANPGYRDFAVVAHMVKGRRVSSSVSLDVSPTSREIVDNLARSGALSVLLEAGARIHQAGCNGCIGMGQAPASGRNSLRTVPRNFPGRSGTREDSVWLCSPETAAASALTGVISDPRDVAKELGIAPFTASDEPTPWFASELLEPPAASRLRPALVKGPNIADLPILEPLPNELVLPVLLVLGDDVSTDEIMPAGARVLPYRSNVPRISDFCFDAVDETYPERARTERDRGHAIVAGHNYGQGSSREHAALAPRYLGLRLLLAKSFARIHWQNLISFGVLPLTLVDEGQAERLRQGDELTVRGLREALRRGPRLALETSRGGVIDVEHQLSPRQVEVLLQGGLINWIRRRLDQRRDGADSTRPRGAAPPSSAPPA